MFTRQPNILKANRKLQGRLVFQGLPISIENRKGSVRHWQDPHNGESGKTKFTYPYGYISGTLGTDGDSVDCFIGPDKDSTKVFVIKQVKTPFTRRRWDENKCFLGWKSSKEAKAAYLKHYNDPRFFGKIKEFSMEEFKELLEKKRGKFLYRSIAMMDLV